MTSNCLVVTVDATHQSLQLRLDEVTWEAKHPRDRRARIDAFTAATSRHLAAVEAVLVPEVCRRAADGKEAAKEYLQHARRLEGAVALLKARSYGELHAAYVPLHEVLDDVRRCLAGHYEAERRIVARLAEDTPEEADRLATRVYRAELTAPTRAHPNLPHTGFAGAVARRVWSVADRFWDVAENRAVPPPIRPHPKAREHESLLSQYFTGGPTMDAEAPLRTRRRRRAA